MKGITIIVILSIIWSIISKIIEKRQIAKGEEWKKKQLEEGGGLRVDLKTSVKTPPQPPSTPVFTVDPEQIRVEALRRRAIQRKKSPEPVVEEVKRVKKEKVSKIRKLHKEVCPVPPTAFTIAKRPIPAHQIANMLKNRRNIRTAVVLSEILRKPLSLRSMSRVN